ncbi:MAG: hypothetical protein IMY76_07150 [Chloroflexi bacterium]|nr:hypothetical protein [Chloroflexota bacterium]
MKIKDFSSIPFQGGHLSIVDRVLGVLKFGTSWINEMKSQEIVAGYLSLGLADAYTLFRNFPLPDFDVPIPLILVGPHGVTLIYNNTTKGIFRAEEEVWSKLEGLRGNYRPVKPNLMLRVDLMTRALEIFLNSLGYRDLPIEGILVLTNPGTHVETIQPYIRIFLVDAISRLGRRLASSEHVLDRRNVRNIMEAMTQHLDPVKEQVIIKPKRVNPAVKAVDDSFNQAISPLQKTFNFNIWQWILLGSLVIFIVIILLVFLLMILTTS